jgi:hypothetical protein
VAEAFGAVFARCPNGRAEDAAGHRAPLVDVASASHGVERGAGGVVGKVFKAGLIGDRSAERSGLAIAGKLRTMFGKPGADTDLDCSGKRGVFVAQGSHAETEARGVESVDGEGAVAALRTTDAAGEEIPGAARGIGERGVNTLEKPGFADLHELGVARRKGHGERIICLD